MSMDGAATARARRPEGKAAPVVVIGFDAMDCDTALALCRRGHHAGAGRPAVAIGALPAAALARSVRQRASGPISPPAFAPTAIAFIAGTRSRSRHTAASSPRRSASAARRSGAGWPQPATPPPASTCPITWCAIAAIPARLRSRSPNGAAMTGISACRSGRRPSTRPCWRSSARHPVFGMKAVEPRHFAPDDHLFRAGAQRTPDEMKQLTDAAAGIHAAEDPPAAKISGGAALGSLHRHLRRSPFRRPSALACSTTPAMPGSIPPFSAPSAAIRCAGSMPAWIASSAGCWRSVDPNATLLVLLSHGMASHHDGNPSAGGGAAAHRVGERGPRRNGLADGACAPQAMADSPPAPPFA